MRPKALEGSIGALVVLGAIALGGAISGQVPQGTAPFDAQKTYPVDALKADLQVLWDILEEGHGGFDRYTPADRAQEELRRGRERPDRASDGIRFLRPAPAAHRRDQGRAYAPVPLSRGRRLSRRPAHPLSLRAPFPRRQGLCLQEPERGPERRRGRGAPGHRRQARRGDPRGAPSAHPERRRDPDREAPPPRIPGRLRQAARPALRPAGILSGPLPASSKAGRPGRSRCRGSRRATSPGSCARDTRDGRAPSDLRARVPGRRPF